MLYTNLKHIESANDYYHFIAEQENIVLICGSMDINSITIYRIVEEIEKDYQHVKFADIEFDNPEMLIVNKIIETHEFKDKPLLIYFKNGELIHISSGIKTKEELKFSIEHTFSICNNTL